MDLPPHKRVWFTLSRDPVLDVIGAVRAVATPDYHVAIGTDSLKVRRRVDFVTVICLHDEVQRKGGCGFFTKRPKPRTNSLREKLALETWESLELAMALADVLPRGKDQISIHIDANTNPRYRSSDYVKELVAMVMGQGFNYVLKPDSWAASHAADRVVRNLHIPSPERKMIQRRTRRRKR